MSRSKGTRAEINAEKFLIEQGLQPLKKNYLCKMGEIDLIMLDKDELVFVEVRLRTNENYGSGAETIQIGKQNKIIKTAKFYLLENYQHALPCCRFDVIEYNNTPDQECTNWIKDAFQLQGFSII